MRTEADLRRQPRRPGVLATCAILLVLTVVADFFARMATPEMEIAFLRSGVVEEQSISASFLVVFAVDFALCYAAISGFYWLRLLRFEAARECAKSYSQLFRNPRVITAIVLCAIPLSAYAVVVFGDRGWLRPVSVRGDAVHFAMVIPIVSVVIALLHAVTVRLGQGSGQKA